MEILYLNVTMETAYICPSLPAMEVIFLQNVSKTKSYLTSHLTHIYIYTFNLCPSLLPWGQILAVLLLLTSEPQGSW